MPGLGEFWPYIIQGLAFGAMYAVTGTGLVVLYRTTGVVNLAFGRLLIRENTPESAQVLLVSQAEGMELISRGAKGLLPSWE